MVRSLRSNRQLSLRLVSAVSVLALCVACGSSKDQSASSRACTPGEQRACACPGAAVGIQVCNSDGSALGACTGCSGSATGGSSSTAANSRTDGGNSSGDTNQATATGGVGQTTIAGAPSTGGATASAGAASMGGATSTTTVVTTSPQAGSSAGGAVPFGGGSNTFDTSAGGVAAAGGAASVGGASPGGGTEGTLQAGGGSTSAAGHTSLGGDTSTGGSGVTSVCGNGQVEGTEGCDPAVRDWDLGDGCTPTCKAEPSCPPSGGACATTCGDGFALGNEACDDGNAVSGDGCSASCQIEDGFSCAPSPTTNLVQVPMVVRDFSAGADFEKGAAFSTGLYFANQGLLQPLLDDRGLKPVLKSTTGTYNGMAAEDSGIASSSTFSQWFDDKAPPAGNTYHATLATTLNLYLDTATVGTYANRYGNEGDGLTDARYTRTYGLTNNFCGIVGEEDHDADGNAIPCTHCVLDEDPSTPQCDPAPSTTYCTTNPDFLYCIQQNNHWYGVYFPIQIDGNPLFFPADGVAKPWSPEAVAMISGNYDEAWPNDPVSRTHNFSFTTEVRFWFKYDASQNYTLSFTGDDDSWVFVNKHLALDMGGIHLPVQGALTINNGQVSATVNNTYPSDEIVNIKSVPDLGTLADGGLYEVVVFQAERQTKGSSYGLSVTSNFAAAPSVCQRAH